MANKIWVLLLLASIGLLLWVTLWPTSVFEPNPTNHLDSDLKPVSTQSDVVADVSEKTAQTIAPETKNTPSDGAEKLDPWQQKVLQEIDSRLFSDDPYVELYSLEFLVGQCRDQDIVERLFVGKGPFYQSQQQLAKKLQQQCAELRTQYQEYLSFPEHEQLIQAFEPNSRMGRLLKQVNNPNLTPLDRSELSSSILKQAIKERNSSSLMYSVFIARFGSLTTLPLAGVINSNDQDYINQMSSMALMMMACQYQGGRTCESTSFYMIIMCSQQPAACGLDFPSWFQKTTLPGMQRDVEKLMTFFSQYGQ